MTDRHSNDIAILEVSKGRSIDKMAAATLRKEVEFKVFQQQFQMT